MPFMKLQDLKNELSYHSALVACDILHMQDIKDLVDQLLKQGIYCDELLGIEDARNAQELKPVLLAALEKLGIERFDIPQEAVWFVLRYHINDITTGKLDAVEGLHRLYDFHNTVYFDLCVETGKEGEYLWSCHGLASLVSYYSGYYDMLERPDEISIHGKTGNEGITELKKEIVKEAKLWASKYS